MVESLPHFAAVAEERKLPIVLSSKTGVPGASFMGKGATYTDGVFTFDLKYKHDAPLPIRVFFPGDGPVHVSLDGAPIESTRDAGRVLHIQAPPSEEFRTARFTVGAQISGSSTTP